MKFRFIALALLALSAFPILAQDGATHSVTFDGFSFSYPSSLAANLNITEIPGDPTDLEQPGGPQVGHTQFTLNYNHPPAPENFFDTSATIRVYRTAEFADYEFFNQELQALQTLLADRPDLTPFVDATEATQENSLPFVPVFPAAQVMRARANYVDTGTLSGISYITLYRQDVAPFLGHEFIYTFQGISSDGSTYVSAVFWIFTDLFPSEFPEDFDYEAFSAEYEQYVVESVATLNNASPDDFAPSLATLDALIGTFSVGATAGETPATPETQPTPQATETAVVDPSLGGLGNTTWTLVSYGSPDNPQPALGAAPVTLTFTPAGVAGNAGCNQFSGSFQYDVNALSFGELITTRMACADDVMAQETAVLNALAAATSFTIENNQLHILYGEGVLTFNSSNLPAPEATDTVDGSTGAAGIPTGTWTLVSYGSPENPQPAIQGSPATLTFTDQGINGQAGCNQYSGSYEFANGTLTFGNIVSTLMACEQSIMDQEIAFLEALQTASSFQLNEGQLQIFYNGGVLTFGAA